MSEMCTDNRYEVIAAYKKRLMERTNIETSPDEMAVIDNVLFRFWQLGWLPPVPHGDLIDRDALKNKKIIFDSDAWDDVFDDGLLFVMEQVDNAPTIIPAEKGDDD